MLVTGDAAGLLEPWTREGISFALRSGTWAGEAAAKGVDGLDSYEAAVREHLVPDMLVGRRLLRAYEKHPHVVHAAMASPLGWRAFMAFCRGELQMAHTLERPWIRALVGVLG